MIPIFQTKQGKNGNCWEACIASILEYPLEDVPEFIRLYKHKYIAETNKWLLRNFELSLIVVNVRDSNFDDYHSGVKLIELPSYHIISGKYYGKTGHSVVGFRGQVIHNPNLTLSCLASLEIMTYEFFVHMNPNQGILKPKFVLSSPVIQEAKETYDRYRKNNTNK